MPEKPKEIDRDRGLLWSIKHPINSSVVGQTMKRFAEPAVFLARDVIRYNITNAIRKKMGMKIDPKILTEDDFTEAYLNTLDSINIANLNKKVPNWRKRVARGETVRMPVRGGDYVRNYGWSNPKGKRRGLLSRLTDPVQQIETTLGSYTVEATKDKITTNDVYDFDRKTKIDTNTAYGKLRKLANYIATPEDGDVPNDEKIQIHITSKLKQQ